jgi:arginyl-tRNA synthetase
VTPADLDRAVVEAVRAATADGELAGAVPDDAALEWAGGGFVSPLPLRLAARAGRTPRQVAEIIARRIDGVWQGAGEVAVIGPGFLSIPVGQPGALAKHIVETADYGRAPGLVRASQATWPDRPRTFDNPGFVVQFAHARAASVRRHARDLGLAAGDPEGRLDEPAERRLLGLLAELPLRAARAAGGAAGGAVDPASYRRHLVRVADAYHDVHERCPALPKGDEVPNRLHGARLTLAEAVRVALNNGLRTLGETPEERL